MKRFIYLLSFGFISLIIASCGGGGDGSGVVGGGGGGTGATSNITMKATALNSKTVVASLAKPSGLKWMLALLSNKEANATHETFCTDKQFSLSDGGHVCIEKAYVVFDEIELEQEDDLATDDDIEFGPFVVDLVGFANDGIPGSITLDVPDGTFDEIKFKVDDLDDDDSDGLQSGDSSDDLPVNVSLADATAAGLVKRSLVIVGSATDGTDVTDFTFRTDIEARISVPFATTVLDASELIAFFDFATGFSNRTFSDFTDTMEAQFKSLPGPPETCGEAGLSAAHQLACDIVMDIDLFEDVDDDDIGDEAEFEGDNSGPGGFDDSGSAD